MKYILGVDGGGTKTEAVAYDLEGNVLYSGSAGYGNILINKETALENIKQAINNCINDLSKYKCICIYMGIAGSSSGNNGSIIKNYIEDCFKCNTIVVNDAELAMSALLKGQDGFLAIAGTGSVCIGKYFGKKVRAGGWGHLLGDEGSGYYIAIEALKKITKEKDLGNPRSDFTKRILNYLKCDNELDIIDFVYKSEKADIAAIVPLIVELSDNNEKAAEDILEEAGRKLGMMTLRAINQISIRKNIEIGIIGSVLTNIKIVRKAFEKELKENLKNYHIYDESISPTKGAYYEVFNLLSTLKGKDVGGKYL